MSSEHSVGSTCKNCGTSLEGPYCHKCGQHDFDFHQSFRHVLHEVLEDLFHFDGKFFKGIYDLLFRPGWLTNEFNAGRRARHMPPLRLYIFISLIYFLVPSSNVEPILDKETANEVKKELVNETKQLKKEKAKQAKEGARFVWNGREVELEETLKEKMAHKDEIAEHFYHYIPKMILVCLPLFALLTRLVFWRGGLNYLQHLVLALHLHSFFFLFSLAKNGWVGLFSLVSSAAGNLLALGCNLYILAYLYFALRAVFGDGYSGKGIVLRSSAVAMGYSLVLMIAALFTVIVAALMV